MAALTGNKIKDSYLGLLKSISNGAISSSFVQISDGGGNALPLYLSTSSIKFYNAYTFPSADGTVSGQVLSTDANGTLSWVTSSDNQTLEEVLTQGNTTTIAISSSADITTSAQFNGDINGALLQKVKAAEALSKGDVVYISGGTGDNPEVSKAKADSSTTMPALGIMKEPLALNAEGECITSGELTGLNLSSSGTIGDFDTGDDLYVSSTTAGGLVDTAPTGEANLIQKIGKVINGGNGGALTVLGAFRTNAVPNLNSAKIFLGNASNQSVSATISGDATISDTGVIALATVPVTKGGTGATTLTGILLGDGTNAISGITSTDDGHVLTADGNGGYAFEVSSGDVSISGTPTANQVAIWTDGSTIKGMSALEIDTNNKITLDQDASSYNIGGGNIANITGTNNTGFGLENLNVVTSGDANVAIGYRALKSLTIGGSNTAIGYNSLEFLSNLVDGHNGNTAVGLSSGRRNNGGFNTFIGFQSGQGSINTSNNNSFNNTALGYFSLNKLTSGNSNTGVGSAALEDNTTGVLNTCLGQGSGKDITTGSKNVILGSFTGFSGGTDIRTSDNNIIISDGSGNNRIQVDSGGNVGIGVTPTDAHQISRTSGTTQDAKNIQLRIGSSTTSLSPYIRFQGQTSSSVNRFADIQLDTVNDLLSFFPPSQYANVSSALNISTGGNVGIGTTTLDANANLTVFGSYQTDFIRDFYGGNRGYVLRFGANTASSGHVIGSQILGTLAGDDVNGSLEFYTKDAGNLRKQLTISSVGDVTIGSANDPYLYMVSSGGNGYNSRFRMYGYADGGTYGGGFKIDTRDSSNVFNNALAISSTGVATFTGLIKFVDTTAGSAGTPQFKTLLSYQYSTINALSTIKGGNEAGGTNGTYLKFSVNSSAAVNTPIDILTLKSAFVGGTTAQFDALIKANNGISFPNQSASSGTSTSETLDAYEEGTWTPNVESTAGGAYTISNARGKYIKVGKHVTVQFYFIVSNVNGGTGAKITNLPFTTKSGAAGDNYIGNSWNTSNGQLSSAVAAQNGTIAYLYVYSGGNPIGQGQGNTGTITYISQS